MSPGWCKGLLGPALVVAATIGAPVQAQAQDPADDGAEAAMVPSQTTSTYGDWTVRCRPRPSPADGPEEGGPTEGALCEMIQAATVAQDNGPARRLMEIAMGRLPGADTVTILVRTPLGVALREGVTVARESGVPGADLSLSYLSCDAQGCLAETTVQPDTIKTLAASDAARVVFVDRAGRRIGVPLSFTGLMAAFHALAAP